MGQARHRLQVINELVSVFPSMPFRRAVGVGVGFCVGHAERCGIRRSHARVGDECQREQLLAFSLRLVV